MSDPPEEERQRRKKRKGAPKNPLSAYTYFIMDVRKDVAAKNPKMSFREVAIAVGKMWHALREEQRKIYNQKAEQDKARYENEMMNWTHMLNAEAAEAAMENKSKKRKKNGPKNPLSAYTYFVIEKRPIVSSSNPKLSFGEVATHVGQMWRALESEGRAKYEQLAREDKERYDREKEMMQNRLSYNITTNGAYEEDIHADGHHGAQHDAQDDDRINMVHRHPDHTDVHHNNPGHQPMMAENYWRMNE